MDTTDIRISITPGPLLPLNVNAPAYLSRSGSGASVCFEGIVRPGEDSKTISAIDYEAYEPMAQKTLHELAREAIDKFGVVAMSIEHSTGRVPVHERSFRMQVVSIHRKEALQAMDWFIDAMKRDVPIWKHPVWQDSCTDSSPSEEVNHA